MPHQFKCSSIIARKHSKTVGHSLNEPGSTLYITRCILDRDDIVNLTEPDNSLIQQVTTGASRDVVKDNGQIDCPGNRLKMLEKTLLGGPVVVRCYRQRVICSCSAADTVSSIASCVELPPVPATTEFAPLLAQRQTG